MLSTEKRLTNVLDGTLKNFLSYLLNTRDEFSNELSDTYSQKERYEFIYSCSLNTIDEYIHNKDYTILLSLSTLSIFNLFKENFRLRMFERILIKTDYISDKTQTIIDEFSCLKESLNGFQKNDIMENLASTTN